MLTRLGIPSILAFLVLACGDVHMSGETAGGDSPGPDAGGDSAAPAEMSADRADLDFGDVVRDKESETASFVITNVGEKPSGVLSTALAGDPVAFLLEGDACAGAVLAAEESCRVEVRFAPEAAGDHAASLQIAADPGGEAMVVLAGRGLEPGSLVFDADNHHFGQVELGETSDPVSLAVENIGQAVTGELFLALSDPHAFLVESDDCSGRALAPSESCTIEVVFSPEVAGHAGGSLTVGDSAEGAGGLLTVGDSAEGAVAVSLGGTGFARLDTKQAGTGSGTIASEPLGIYCGDTCSASFVVPEVILSATPHAGSTFAGWEGPCQGTGSCSIAMTASKSVTARFELLKRSLQVSKSGSGTGTVVSSPSGISCGNSCSASFDHGTSVTLVANPSSASVFTGWSGACSGSGPTCSVSMTANSFVSATFSPKVHTLAVSKENHTLGTVTSSPSGIHCGDTCSSASASYLHGVTVTLTAIPKNVPFVSPKFLGWSGACSGTGTCTVSMTQSRSVTAVFGF